VRLRSKVLTVLLLVVVVPLAANTLPTAQRFEDFTVRTPLEEGEVLILGFQGGREDWNAKTAVGRLAARLRGLKLPGVHVETVENRKRHLAVRLVREALDRDRDGRLAHEELARPRVILYGHSFGGAAVVKLARELDRLGVPVLLTVQIDSVGRGDARVPPNVARAANLFQSSGQIIRGEPEIVAEDPERTEIVGNFGYDYDERQIDISKVPLMKKIFRAAHAKMELDEEVWSRVEQLILSAVPAASSGQNPAPRVESRMR
jgi:pimeloyl-ACP methyl ester carboxylesterase